MFPPPPLQWLVSSKRLEIYLSCLTLVKRNGFNFFLKEVVSVFPCTNKMFFLDMKERNVFLKVDMVNKNATLEFISKYFTSEKPTGTEDYRRENVVVSPS